MFFVITAPQYLLKSSNFSCCYSTCIYLKKNITSALYTAPQYYCCVQHAFYICNSMYLEHNILTNFPTVISCTRHASYTAPQHILLYRPPMFPAFNSSQHAFCAPGPHDPPTHLRLPVKFPGAIATHAPPLINKQQARYSRHREPTPTDVETDI